MDYLWSGVEWVFGPCRAAVWPRHPHPFVQPEITCSPEFHRQRLEDEATPVVWLGEMFLAVKLRFILCNPVLER